MIEELIAKVFEARNVAHLAHWSTSSYAQHVALGGFYDGAIDSIDAIAECYQGAFNKVGKVKLTTSDRSVIPLLTEQVIWIKDNREAICQDLSPLENLVDGLMELYLSTLYKLNHLS